MNREEWLAERQKGIGGSDAAVVMGLSPWKSRIQLWMEKTGRVPMPDEEREEFTWGLLLEEPIAQRYMEVTKRNVRRSPFAILTHPDKPFLKCTPDGIIEASDEWGRGEGILEIKTAWPFAYNEWMEQVPIQYQIQVQHNLMVSGAEWGSFALLFGNRKFAHLDVRRHADFLPVLVEEEERFWDLVQRDEMPEPDESKLTNEALKRLVPEQPIEQIVLPEEALRWWQNREEATADIKQAEGVKTRFENKLLYAMKDAGEGLLPDGRILAVKRSAIQARTQEVKAHIQTRLSVKEKK